MTRNAPSKIVSALCALLVAWTFVHVALAWPSMPDIIPTHYGLDGLVDGWGGKPRILIVPLLMLALYAGIEVAERHPKWWNTGVKVTEENREDVYRNLGGMLASVKALLVMSMSAISAVQVEGGPQPWFLLPASVIAIIAVTAFWIARLYRMR